MKTTSEAMRAWAEALLHEVGGWPGVTIKRAFGMTLVYRSGLVFAALPGSRALYAEDAILLKFITETPALAKRIASEKRFAAGTMEQKSSVQLPTQPRRKGEGRKWRIFIMTEDSDFHSALEWLAKAYRFARNTGA
jgi:hypothetical protein